MSTTNNDLYREAIRRMLTHNVEGALDASAIAEAAFSIWRQVVAQLAPVIGVRGVDILFNRSLHLTSFAFHWLAIVEDYENIAALLASLKARLAGRDPDDAAEACYTLLVTFTELLTTLIGESLTERLLGPVWAHQSPPAEKETKS